MAELLARGSIEQLLSPMLRGRPYLAVSIGLLRGDVQQTESFGVAKADSIYEVGSISKTFTVLALARMVVEGKVCLNDPVRKYLDPLTSPQRLTSSQGGKGGESELPPRKEGDTEITLLDLATHRSGLPRIPGNMKPATPLNPYADYGAKDLYAELRRTGLVAPKDPKFDYSNLGFGLLGFALAQAAQTTYPELIRSMITEPLELPDTGMVSGRDTGSEPARVGRFLPGFSERGKPMPYWRFDVLAGCGALHSTVTDLLLYLKAHLNPDQFAGQKYGLAGLTDALKLVQKPEADGQLGLKIALAWNIAPNGALWKNGGTFGFSSFATFRAESGVAIVALVNTFSAASPPADRIGLALGQMLRGQTVAPLS